MRNGQVMQRDAMRVSKLSADIGAEVTGIDLRQPVDEATRRRLEAALVENVALVIRGQDFTPQQFLAAVNLFGEPMEQHFTEDQIPGCPLVNTVSNRKEGMVDYAKKRGGGWHTDHTNHRLPPKFTALYMVAMPSEGGNTAVCNTRAGYALLPDALKQRLADMKTNNVFMGSAVKVAAGASVMAQARQKPEPVLQPLIRTNPDNGSKALYFHPTKTENIVGMTPEASQDLIDDLLSRVLKPEHIYSHKWQKGDMLIWDNRASLHRGESVVDPNQLRLLYRVIVRGELPH